MMPRTILGMTAFICTRRYPKPLFFAKTTIEVEQMGGFGSGHHRSKRPTVETARRLTLDEAHAIGVEIVFQSMPRNRRRKMGICPKCQRPARMFYQDGDRAACRLCLGLTYRSSQEQRKPSRVLVKQQPTLSAGLRALETWQQMPHQNQREFSNAMAIFEGLAIVDGQPQAQPAQPETHQSRREATVEDDLQQSAKMLRQLETAIADTPSDSAMLPKLVNAFVALSNMRDTRAKIADEIKTGRPAEGDRLTIVEIINRQMQNNDDERYLQLQGIAMESKMQRSALK
jgi:hypothetical protein